MHPGPLYHHSLVSFVAFLSGISHVGARKSLEALLALLTFLPHHTLLSVTAGSSLPSAEVRVEPRRDGIVAAAAVTSASAVTASACKTNFSFTAKGTLNLPSL